MSIQHKARTGKIYYLHVMPGKGGRPSYHFSKDPEGTLADAIPEGYEIYENIGGQVFLRRKTPQVITDAELAMVNAALQRLPATHFYQTEVKENALVIYEAENRTEEYQLMAMPWINRDRLAEHARESAYYQAVMRFVLVDPAKRLFSAERYCFRGSVEDWISISMDSAPLSAQLKKFLRHLGKESFFELFAWS